MTYKVTYTVVDNELLEMKQAGMDVYPFARQTLSTDDQLTAIVLALKKATANRVRGYKKTASAKVGEDGTVSITIEDVESKTLNSDD